jgi:hypothetical protein
VVFTTLQSLEWNNSTLLTGDVAEQLKLRQQPGMDNSVTGSATLVGWLLREGLLEELRLLLHPIVVGTGLLARSLPAVLWRGTLPPWRGDTDGRDLVGGTARPAAGWPSGCGRAARALPPGRALRSSTPVEVAPGPCRRSRPTSSSRRWRHKGGHLGPRGRRRGRGRRDHAHGAPRAGRAAVRRRRGRRAARRRQGAGAHAGHGPARPRCPGRCWSPRCDACGVRKLGRDL